MKVLLINRHWSESLGEKFLEGFRLKLYFMKKLNQKLLPFLSPQTTKSSSKSSSKSEKSSASSFKKPKFPSKSKVRQPQYITRENKPRNNLNMDTSLPAYVNILKALLGASYRLQGLRRTFLTDWQAAELFGFSYGDFKEYEPNGMEDAINYDWAQRLSQGPCLVLALQRHGACYFLGGQKCVRSNR